MGDETPSSSNLTNEHRAELERRGPRNVRLRLRYAGPGSGSVVPGLGDGRMLRSDVEDWLFDKEIEASQKSLQVQEDTLRWAKLAAWIGVAGILVAIVIAVLGR
jgi:hypothetical protein